MEHYLQGAKIRSTYVDFAKKEQKRLEEAIQKLTAEVKEKQLEVDRTQGDILCMCGNVKEA